MSTKISQSDVLQFCTALHKKVKEDETGSLMTATGLQLAIEALKKDNKAVVEQFFKGESTADTIKELAIVLKNVSEFNTATTNKAGIKALNDLGTMIAPLMESTQDMTTRGTVRIAMSRFKTAIATAKEDKETKINELSKPGSLSDVLMQIGVCFEELVNAIGRHIFPVNEATQTECLTKLREGKQKFIETLSSEGASRDALDKIIQDTKQAVTSSLRGSLPAKQKLLYSEQSFLDNVMVDFKVFEENLHQILGKEIPKSDKKPTTEEKKVVEPETTPTEEKKAVETKVVPPPTEETVDSIKTFPTTAFQSDFDPSLKNGQDLPNIFSKHTTGAQKTAFVGYVIEQLKSSQNTPDEKATYAQQLTQAFKESIEENFSGAEETFLEQKLEGAKEEDGFPRVIREGLELCRPHSLELHIGYAASNKLMTEYDEFKANKEKTGPIEQAIANLNGNTLDAFLTQQYQDAKPEKCPELLHLTMRIIVTKGKAFASPAVEKFASYLQTMQHEIGTPLIDQILRQQRGTNFKFIQKKLKEEEE